MMGEKRDAGKQAWKGQRIDLLVPLMLRDRIRDPDDLLLMRSAWPDKPVPADGEGPMRWAGRA